MKKISILFFLILNQCSWFEGSAPTASDSANLSYVEEAVEHLNNRNIDKYLTYFSPNINVFASNGLGTTRIATGISDFKGYSSAFTKAKTFKVKILSKFSVSPWVFVHQQTKAGSSLLEAAVVYRIDQGKIVDMMIIGEKNSK
ncbi:MAG: nuclear transport factor 2 family protein [Bdellovibrionales bacterium]|nr:nuclear transport factor 2 family protein [Bdellovibrionales bacterium]